MAAKSDLLAPQTAQATSNPARRTFKPGTPAVRQRLSLILGLEHLSIDLQEFTHIEDCGQFARK
jgi:hypothetical protein